MCETICYLFFQCGLHLLQLYTDLCVYAINFDKGCCEQQMIQGNMEGVKKQQWAISVTCIKLADLYCNCNPKLARIAALTAFSLHPSIQNFNVVRKTFVDKRKEKMQAVKEDSSEEKGKETPQKTNKPRQSKYLQKVNPATIHEVERLLNMLRPYYLDPEMGFEKLQPVCQKFMDERGGGISEPPKKPSKPPPKVNSSRQNSSASRGGEDSAALSRPKTATSKPKTPPITPQPSTSTASAALAKAPLFGNKPRSYRAMSQPDAVPKPKKVQSNVVNQRLVPAIQPQLAPKTAKTTAVDSTSNISELLKATKTLPQNNSSGSPSAAVSSYSSSPSASIPQRPGSGLNVHPPSSDLLRRHSVNLPINAGAPVARSEVIGDAGDKSIYHHLYKPLKTQEPTNLKTAKPPSNKLQVTNVLNKFTGPSSSYNVGGQTSFQSSPFNSLNRPAEGMNFPVATAGSVDQRRPSAEELQSIVDWLQSGTEDAVSKQNNASFNPLTQPTPPPAHTQQMSFPVRGQNGPNSQTFSLPSSQKVDLNTLLTKPQVVSSALKIPPKERTAVQEAASQISQRLTDIRTNSDPAAGDMQLLMNLQKTISQKQVKPPNTPNPVQSVPENSGKEKNLQKNLTDKDLSLEEMRRRIADIVQKQKLLCESKPDQPAKRRRSASPKGKKGTGSATSTPTKGLNLNVNTGSPAPAASAISVKSESRNLTTQPSTDVQKKQIQEWFSSRLQVQQQIEKVKQQPQSNSSLSKPQFILQQQAAPVHFVSAEQIENLHSNSAQRAAENYKASQSLSEQTISAQSQKSRDHYDQRLGFPPRSSQVTTPNKYSLLEQKLSLDDGGATAVSQGSNNANSFSPSLNIHQLRMLQGTAEGFSQERRLSNQVQFPPHTSQGNPQGVAYGNLNSKGKQPFSDEGTPTTLLSVLLEQSKYINSVAATSASNKPSQNESLPSSQPSTNVQPFSTVSNSVLASMVSTSTSDSPIRTSAQQTLSFLLPQTAHCGKQDVINNSNNNSPSTSSKADYRKTVRDSPKQSPVGFQLQYMGQIKTKEIPSMADPKAELFGGNKSGLEFNKSTGVKLLTCMDNDVVKEITKIIGGEKKQPNIAMDLPIQPKAQYLGENMNVNSRIPMENVSPHNSVQNKKEFSNVTCSSEKPVLLTDLNSHDKGDVTVKNYRQSLIDSLENGIKQSMEQIDISAELLDKSPKKSWPQNLNREQTSKCSESFKNVYSAENIALPQFNTEDALVETSEKIDRSAESQNSTDEIKEHGANKDENLPLCSLAQPLVSTQQVESLATENVLASEVERNQENVSVKEVVEASIEETSAEFPCRNDIADQIYVPVSQSCVPEEGLNRKTLPEAEDAVISESGLAAEEQGERKETEVPSYIPPSVQPTLDTNNAQAPEENLVNEKIEGNTESLEKAITTEKLSEAPVNEEQALETVSTDIPSSGSENQITAVDHEEKEQESEVKDSESGVTEDQSKEDVTSTQGEAHLGGKEIPVQHNAEIPIEPNAEGPSESKGEIPSEQKIENAEMDHAETQEEIGENSLKENLCMEDIKLDNIDRSKVIHKLKNDMNNLLHQIDDLNGGHGSQPVEETLEDINCHEAESKDENSQILTLSNTIEKLDVDVEGEKPNKVNKDAVQDVNTSHTTEASDSVHKEEEKPEVCVVEEDVKEAAVEEMELKSTDVSMKETEEKKEEPLSDVSAAAVVEPESAPEPEPEHAVQAKEAVCLDKTESEGDLKDKKEVEENDKVKGVEEEKEVIEEGNRKLDKFRKNQKRKKSDVPVNFGFDFNEESNAEDKNEEKKPPSEESEIVKISPNEPRHRKLKGSAILKTRKKYRENLQGAQEMAEKIKEHIISGTKVVEITEKKALTSVIESKTVSSEIKKNVSASNATEMKKNVSASNRVSDPDIDTHSVSSNSSSSSIPSVNQLPTSHPLTEKEKGAKEVSGKINKCQICGKEFRSVFSLKEHVKNKCKPTDFIRLKDYEFTSRFTCSKCGMTCSSASDMKKHMKKQHSVFEDRDFKDMLISSYRCEMCGETFKDKMAIYSHVSASCPQLESRRRELKAFVNEKRGVKNVPNLGSSNHGKQFSATVNQSQQPSRNSLEKIPVCKNEGQRQVKSVEINSEKQEEGDSKAAEVCKIKENATQPPQEIVSSPSDTSSSEPKKEAAPQPVEQGQEESSKNEEVPVVSQRVTRSKLDRRSASTRPGKNHTKDTQQQLEKSGRKPIEDKKKGKTQVEDACRKLSFDGSQNKAVVKEEIKTEQVTGKEKSTEKKNIKKESSEEQSKTSTMKRQLRTRNSSLSPNTPANDEKKEIGSSSPPDQEKSKPSTPSSCSRLTRSKGTVEKVDYNDLEKIELNFRRSHTRHHSGSTDVSMLSECSEAEQQQQLKSPEPSDKKKSVEEKESSESEGTTSVSNDVECGQDTKVNRKRKEPASVQPLAEVPTRGKRLIKVKKFDQFEVPDFLKSQVNNSNKKRQIKWEPNSEKIKQKSAATKSASSKKESKKCSRCGKQFTNQTSLIKHIVSVHLSPCKPSANARCSFQCRYCKATYKSYSQFLNHVPGHSTQILEGLESTQIAPAVIHSKPIYSKNTEVTKSTDEESSETTAEEVAENDGKMHVTRQSENKVKEQTENAITTRSRRSTTSVDSEQDERVKQKSQLNTPSNTEETKLSTSSEERTLTTRSRSKSGRGLDKIEEKSDGDKTSSSRQLRSRAESGGKMGDLSKKESSSTVGQSTSQQKSEHRTRSNSKRKSDCKNSPAPAKKTKEDVSESKECDNNSEFELAGSDAEISFRKRLPLKRKVQVDFIGNCDSDIEELEKNTADDKDCISIDDHEEEVDVMDDDLGIKVKKMEDGGMDIILVDGDDDEITTKKSQEKVSVAVVEDDEFDYVKSPTRETCNKEMKKCSVSKEKIVLSRSSKDHSAYLNSYMSYIDKQSRRTQDLKERSEKVSLQNSKKKPDASKKPRPTSDLNREIETEKDKIETEKDTKGVTNVNQTPTSFLDSFLEHCSKTDDNNRDSPVVPPKKGGETSEDGDQSNGQKTKSNQMQNTR